MGDLISNTTSFKNIYALGGGLVLAVAKPFRGADIQMASEVDMLDELKANNIDVVQTSAGFTYNGNPAIVMERLEGSNRDFSWDNFGKVEALSGGQGADLAALVKDNKEKALESLEKIRDSVVLSKTEIQDIQFLVAGDGTFVVNDPLEVKTGGTGVHRETVDSIEALMKHIKSL